MAVFTPTDGRAYLTLSMTVFSHVIPSTVSILNIFILWNCIARHNYCESKLPLFTLVISWVSLWISALIIVFQRAFLQTLYFRIYVSCRQFNKFLQSINVLVQSIFKAIILYLYWRQAKAKKIKDIIEIHISGQAIFHQTGNFSATFLTNNT